MSEHQNKILQDLQHQMQAIFDPYFADSDPSAYVAMYTNEITYFDPWTGGKLVGTAAREHLMGLAGGIPPFDYEIIDPSVQLCGEVAVLTFNLAMFDRETGDRFAVWNTTQIHDRSGGSADLVHAHWSYSVPPVEQEA